jgi:hypothetical protein
MAAKLFILIERQQFGKKIRLTTVTVVAETDTEVKVTIEAEEEEHVGLAPVTETVVVLVGTEEQSVEGRPVVGHVLVTVEVTVTVRVEPHAEVVGDFEEEDLVFVEEDVVVIKQEHAELTREGKLLHWVENGPRPEAVAV